MQRWDEYIWFSEWLSGVNVGVVKLIYEEVKTFIIDKPNATVSVSESLSHTSNVPYIMTGVIRNAICRVNKIYMFLFRLSGPPAKNLRHKKYVFVQKSSSWLPLSWGRWISVPNFPKNLANLCHLERVSCHLLEIHWMLSFWIQVLNNPVDCFGKHFWRPTLGWLSTNPIHVCVWMIQTFAISQSLTVHLRHTCTGPGGAGGSRHG